MIIALLLASSPLPNIHDLPRYDPAEIDYCRRTAEWLELYVARFDGYITKREIDNGRSRGFTAQQSADIRFAAQAVMRPYIEDIREIAWKGDGQRCMDIAAEGRTAVYEEVIRPVLGVLK